MISPIFFPVVVFDLDGTLMLTLEPKARTAALVWREIFDVSADDVNDAYLRYSGPPRYELFQRIAEDILFRSLSDREYRRLSEEFTRRNIEALREYPFVAGAEAFLSDLKQAGIVMAISSSAEPAEVDARLKDCRYSSFFRAIMGSHGKFQKGRPHLEHLAKMTNHPPETMLMVGDEPHDLYVARAAGAQIALVAQTRQMEELQSLLPDILVSTLPELRQYILAPP